MMSNQLAGLVVVGAFLAPACFHPNYDHPRCGPSGECPSGLTCNAQLICEGGLDSAPNDSAVDSIDAPSGICIGRFVLVCRPVAPPKGENVVLLTPATINTDLDARCAMQSQGTGAPQLCVMAGYDIKVDAVITVVGSHPLVLAAFHDLNITFKGNLALTSPRGQMPGAGANDPACHAPTNGGNGATGAGGGAGGSFGGTGGAGGTGETGNTTVGVTGAPITPFVRMTGGCKGSNGGNAGLAVGGQPGNGGGAVMLIAANKLTLAGTVTAGGGGGEPPPLLAGGGGGGSGGFVGLDGVIYYVTGQATANGGAGASGSGSSLLGSPGEDGIASTTVAASGGVPPLGGGAGGDGSIAALQNSSPGQPGVNGGGGGGGGAGVILLKGTAPAGGTYSPPPTIVP